MPVRSLLRVFLAVLWLWPAAASGQPAELDDANNRFMALYAQGRYQEALPFAKNALRLGEREFGPDHLNTTTFLNNLAELYRVQGRYAVAEPLYERSLSIREKALGPDHPDVATSLVNYAALLRETGRDAEAEKLEARAEAIKAKHGEENP